MKLLEVLNKIHKQDLKKDTISFQVVIGEETQGSIPILFMVDVEVIDKFLKTS